jgi:hypothetical protein
MSGVSAPLQAHDGSTAADSRATQRGRILKLLIEARGGWVPLPEISACAAQYNARIFEIRRLGFRIENRTREVAGVRHSSFRLVSGPAQAATFPDARHTDSADPEIAAAAERQQETLPLFPEGDRS